MRSSLPCRPATVVPVLAAMALAAGAASVAFMAGTAAAVTAPACTAADISWTPLSATSPTTATVTLTSADPTASCSVSLNSYATAGPTWATSNPQLLDTHDTVTLTAANPTAVLSAPFTLTSSCFGQSDLYGGTIAYDGADGPVPAYPSVLIAGKLDAWNGSVACTPTTPPIVPPLPPTTTSAPPLATLALSLVTPSFPPLDTACDSGVTVSSFTVPTTPGIAYWVDGSGPIAGGTVETVGAGTSVRLSATADVGFTLAGQQLAETFTVPSAPPCVPPATDPHGTGVTGGSTPRAVGVAPPKTTVALPVKAPKTGTPLATEPSAALPFTGLPTIDVALVGLGLIGAGAGLVAASRRRAHA